MEGRVSIPLRTIWSKITPAILREEPGPPGPKFSCTRSHVGKCVTDTGQCCFEAAPREGGPLPITRGLGFHCRDVARLVTIGGGSYSPGGNVVSPAGGPLERDGLPVSGSNTVRPYARAAAFALSVVS